VGPGERGVRNVWSTRAFAGAHHCCGFVAPAGGRAHYAKNPTNRDASPDAVIARRARSSAASVRPKWSSSHLP
jgi:hypothetical protein